MADKQFVEGFNVETKKFDNGGEIIKLGVNLNKFMEFATEHENDRGFVNIDFKKGKDSGKWYAELNTYKGGNITNAGEIDETINEEEIPF